MLLGRQPVSQVARMYAVGYARKPVTWGQAIRRKSRAKIYGSTQVIAWPTWGPIDHIWLLCCQRYIVMSHAFDLTGRGIRGGGDRQVSQFGYLLGGQRSAKMPIHSLPGHLSLSARYVIGCAGSWLAQHSRQRGRRRLTPAMLLLRFHRQESRPSIPCRAGQPGSAG